MHTITLNSYLSIHYFNETNRECFQFGSGLSHHELIGPGVDPWGRGVIKL